MKKDYSTNIQRKNYAESCTMLNLSYMDKKWFLPFCIFITILITELYTLHTISYFVVDQNKTLKGKVRSISMVFS